MIGIEPGKPFDLLEKLKAAMERGVVDADFYMQKLDTKPASAANPTRRTPGT